MIYTTVLSSTAYAASIHNEGLSVAELFAKPTGAEKFHENTGAYLWDTSAMHSSIISQAFWRALLLLSALALLRYSDLEQLDNVAVLVIAGLMAIPIAAYRVEYRLFARRAVLIRGCAEDSPAQKWLWRGSLIKLFSYIMAFFMSLLILVAVSSLTEGEWLILLTASLGLVALEAATAGFARHQAIGDFLPIFHRGLIKWPIIILVVASSALLAFNARYPLYLNQDIVAVTERAFDTQLARFASPLLGYCHALLSWSDTVLMYLAQNYVPRLEDRSAKWVVWIYVSVKSALSTGLPVYLLLGLLTLGSIKQRKGWRLLGRTVLEKYFTLTFILLFAVYLYAVNITIVPPADKRAQPDSNCDKVLQTLAGLNRERKRELSEQEQALQVSVNSKIDRRLDEIFLAAEAGVDSYLDWHFSVLGEYQRLGVLVLRQFDYESPDKLATLVLQGIDPGIATLQQELDSQILMGINESARHSSLLLPEALASSDCLSSFNATPPVFDSNPVFVGQPQTLVAGGAIAALAGKKMMAKASAKGAGKVAGKYGASLATGLTAATLCGPFAPLCGIGAAAVTWVAVDAAIVSADEMLNREELRRDIVESLDQQRDFIKAQMLALYRDAISADYDIIERSFSIPEDGIGR